MRPRGRRVRQSVGARRHPGTVSDCVPLCRWPVLLRPAWRWLGIRPRPQAGAAHVPDAAQRVARQKRRVRRNANLAASGVLGV